MTTPFEGLLQPPPRKLTIFRFAEYHEDPAQRLYQRIEQEREGTEVVKETLGPVYRALAHGEEDRLDSVVVYDPDDFEPRRLVPVVPVA